MSTHLICGCVEFGQSEKEEIVLYDVQKCGHGYFGKVGGHIETVGLKLCECALYGAFCELLPFVCTARVLTHYAERTQIRRQLTF
jgi:hypothetical protein